MFRRKVFGANHSLKFPFSDPTFAEISEARTLLIYASETLWLTMPIGSFCQKATTTGVDN